MLYHRARPARSCGGHTWLHWQQEVRRGAWSLERRRERRGQGGASWLRAAMERDRLSQRGDFVPLFKRCTWQFTCRKWQPTPALVPGKFHGWRNLVGYSPWGDNELDTTKQLRFHMAIYKKAQKDEKREREGGSQSSAFCCSCDHRVEGGGCGA